MERVCGNYYVTAARAKDKKDDGETRPSSNGSSKGGKKGKIGYRGTHLLPSYLQTSSADTPEEHPLPVLIYVRLSPSSFLLADIIADTPEEHPLPSAAGPFAPRNTTFSFSKTVQKIKMAVGS